MDDHTRAIIESFQRITIAGWVACGHPIDMSSQEEEIEVPSKLVRKNTYAPRVRGDSIKDANIIDGDVVIIDQSQLAENGEKVVARINHKEVTLKTLRLDRDGVKLIPAHRSMEPIILTTADVKVLGIVRGVIRDRI